MNKELNSALGRLTKLRENHSSAGKAVLQLDRGIYMIDIFANATLNRSLQLTAAFCTLIQSKNLISAAPLLRLQLDNCLRFYATTLVSDANAFILKILSGESIRKMRDRSGNLMTDAYLVKQLSAYFAWVPNVYEHTSGYIHLSDKHILSATRLHDGQEFTLKISEEDEHVPPKIYVEAVAAFCAATELLFRMVAKYAEDKKLNAPVIESP